MRDDSTKDHSHSSVCLRRPERKKFAPLVPPVRRSAPAKPAAANAIAAPQRIAKVMARAGACSRRDAEAWIGAGRVALNGVVLASPAVNVTDADEITIDGAPLAGRGKTRLFLFHKPRGLVTTERDPEGRQTIFDYLREHWPEAPRLISVGRLDINTEGLLLLTNDGGLARVLELPSTGWVRRYRVRAKGATDQATLDRLRHGVTVDGVAYAEIEAKLDRAQGANVWLTMGLREGKNREIKRVLEHLGLEVNRLIRLSFGPFQLAELAAGELHEAPTRVLRDQLGPALAIAAGVDFTGLARPAEAPALSDASRARQTPPKSSGDDGANRPMRGKRKERLGEPPRAEARKKPAPGPRKHVSVLRHGDGEQAARKRILRSETADRSGRSVPVERLIPVEPAARGRPRTPRPAGRQEEAAPATRNARRFEAERKWRDSAAKRPAHGRARAEDGDRWQKRPAKSLGPNPVGFADRGEKRARGFAAGGREDPPLQNMRGPNKRGAPSGKPSGAPRSGPGKGRPRGKP